MPCFQTGRGLSRAIESLAIDRNLPKVITDRAPTVNKTTDETNLIRLFIQIPRNQAEPAKNTRKERGKREETLKQFIQDKVFHLLLVLTVSTRQFDKPKDFKLLNSSGQSVFIKKKIQKSN